MPPRSILITGASSGIGAALAHEYAVSGAYLFLTGRNAERLEDVAARCRGAGASVESRAMDILDRAVAARWIADCDACKPLDLVIANAGISGGTAGEGWIAAERRIFDVNVTGVLNTVEPALALMTQRGSGQIGIMSSVASFSGWPGAPAYSASKGAVRMWAEGLRGAVRPSGVRINAICPGFVETPMTAVNDFPMPFRMPADRAAKIIADGLAADRARIAFPKATYFLAGLFGFLPAFLSVPILSRLPGKARSAG